MAKQTGFWTLFEVDAVAREGVPCTRPTDQLA
jgi:hypothetical protein